MVRLGCSDREVVVPLRCPAHELRPPTDLRGTVLAASFQLVRMQGREQAYFSALARDLHEAIRFVDPLTWVPLEVARAHFRAMQATFPEPTRQVENGRMASERTQKTYLQTVVRALHGSGQVTALDFIKRVPSAVERMLRNGGGVSVFSLGPKDARVEMHAHPLVETDYIRNSWQGMIEAGLSLVTRRAFVRQDRRFGTSDRFAFDIAWV
jgi:hypothetical protein